MLKERSFASRAFADGRKRFVVPIEEIEAAFWACPAGLSMKVNNKWGWSVVWSKCLLGLPRWAK